MKYAEAAEFPETVAALRLEFRTGVIDCLQFRAAMRRLGYEGPTLEKETVDNWPPADSMQPLGALARRVVDQARARMPVAKPPKLP